MTNTPYTPTPADLKNEKFRLFFVRHFKRMLGATRTAFKHYMPVVGYGRASRSEFWYFMATINLVSLLLLDVSQYGILSKLWGLFIFLPSISVQMRRLQDIGRDGRWFFISLTIIGLIPLIYWWCQKSEEAANQYGEPSAWSNQAQSEA